MKKYGWIWVLIATVIIVGFLIIMTGCVSQQACSKRFPCLRETDTTHTVVTTVTRHDTVFKFQADSSALEALIDCSQGKARLTEILAYTQGKVVKIPIIKMKHDTLVIECRVDSSKVAVTYFEKHTTEFTKIKNQAVQIEFRKTKFDGFTFWWFFISAGLIFIFLLIKFGIPLIKKAVL